MMNNIVQRAVFNLLPLNQNQTKLLKIHLTQTVVKPKPTEGNHSNLIVPNYIMFLIRTRSYLMQLTMITGLQMYVWLLTGRNMSIKVVHRKRSR